MLQERRRDEGLERRAGLERLGHRRISERRAADSVAGESENFPGVRIHHYDVAAFRFQAVDSDRELALADVLKRVVDGQHHGRAGPRLIRPTVGRIEGPSVIVAGETHPAGVATQEAVECELKSIHCVSTTVKRADDSPDASGIPVNALQHGREVDTVQLGDRGNVRGSVESG